MQLSLTVEDADGAVLDSADWELSVDVQPVDELEETCTVRVRYNGSVPMEARIRAELPLPIAADEEPYWLVPGVFYGANRDEECTRLYPRYVIGRSDIDALESDHWAFRADRAATPVVFSWGRTGGFALDVAADTSLGHSGLGFGAGPERPASLWVSLPYREEPFSYVGEPRGVEPLAATYRWEPGEAHEIRIGRWTLPADRTSYVPVLRRLRERQRAAVPPVRPWVDVTTAAELAAYGLWRWHYRPDPAVLIETALFDRELAGDVGQHGDRHAMHVAWVSGIPYAHALLLHGRRAGNAEYVEAGIAVIDHITSSLTPVGTFHGTWYAEHGWSQSWTPVRGGLHARTLAEATLFTVRALAAEAEQHPGWEAAARSNLEFAIAAQEAEGNFGSLYHRDSGEVLSRRGDAGLTWIAALAEAYELFGDERYLDAARRGGGYYASSVVDGTLCGAPEDVDLAPTSEDGYAAVISYVALHRVDPQDRWVELARWAAEWMLTFGTATTSASTSTPSSAPTASAAGAPTTPARRTSTSTTTA
ncbi:hypothetical protein [Kribbella amoyensis]|uniref:hypothetical protein n=1 Tax=Kribbella amoyensis TaxID=996641 RepID=UPI00119E6E5F|nr:hypothetical protein [Kribbella amoyensis]